MGRPITKRPSQDISTDLADKLVCDARRVQSLSTSVASIPRQRPEPRAQPVDAVHYSVVAVRHQRGYISEATLAWAHRSFDGDDISLVYRIRSEAGFLIYFPFLLPLPLASTSRREAKVAFPALWGKIIDGPVLITAMDDLQQGDRVVADAGINLGCIHERQCSKTDGDCHLAIGLVCIYARHANRAFRS